MTSPDADNSSPSTGASNTIDPRASESQSTAPTDSTCALDQNERIDVSKHVTGDVPHVDTDINSNGKPGERESRLTHASNPEYLTYGMIRQPGDDNGGESQPCGDSTCFFMLLHVEEIAYVYTYMYFLFRYSLCLIILSLVLETDTCSR